MEEIFEILVQDYHRMVFAYALSLVNDVHLAEDITQEAFVTAYRRIEEYDKTRDFGAWVRGIARNLAFAEGRKSQRFRFVRLEGVDETLLKSFAAGDEASATLWQRREEALLSCLEKADMLLRAAVKLHYFERMSCEGVAERLGIGVEAVWKRLSRGRHELRRCVDERMAGKESEE